MDKYEYLTGEDLGLKPSAAQPTKFEYSPLCKIFNKGLEKEEDEEEGLLKRLKNIEDHGRKLLDEGSRSLRSISYFSQLSTNAKES